MDPEPAKEAVKESVKTATQDVVAGAAESLKKKGGIRRILGHLLEETAEVGLGAISAYAGSRAAKQIELKHASKHAQALRTEGKHEEANSLLNAALAAFTLKDEAAEFRAFPRAVKHFNRIGEPTKAVQLLTTFSELDEIGLNRLGEILLDCGDEDAQYEYLVNWGDATPDQQKQMLRIVRVELPPEHQAGHVLATELDNMFNSLAQDSRTNRDRIKQKIRGRRALSQQARVNRQNP